MSRPIRILLTVLRALVPLVLLAGGIGSLVYGVGRHTAMVSLEQEVEVNLAGPPGVAPPGFDGALPPGVAPPGMIPPGDGFGPPGGLGLPDGGFTDPALAAPPPWLAPPPELAKVKQKIVISEATSELALIREVTFGGVTRLKTGELWRTYTGAPPSLCPT